MLTQNWICDSYGNKTVVRMLSRATYSSISMKAPKNSCECFDATQWQAKHSSRIANQNRFPEVDVQKRMLTMSCRKMFIYLGRSIFYYSGTSLLRSHTGLGKSDLNGEVIILQGANVLLSA